MVNESSEELLRLTLKSQDRIEALKKSCEVCMDDILRVSEEIGCLSHQLSRMQAKVMKELSRMQAKAMKENDNA